MDSTLRLIIAATRVQDQMRAAEAARQAKAVRAAHRPSEHRRLRRVGGSWLSVPRQANG